MTPPGAPTALRVFSRNCTVRRIDKDTADCFLSACHDLGTASCRYRYGLFVSRTTGAAESRLEAGTLVAVATFSAARRMRDGSRSFEWIRYASLPDVRAVGGMGKLLQTFVDEVHPDDVMTYAQAGTRAGAGEVYVTLGFEKESEVRLPGGIVNLKFRKKF